MDLLRTASTTASVGTITADATRPRRLKWYDIIFGAQGTVGDNPFLYTIQRCTAAGTSTAVVPQPLDPADAATEADAGENHTIEPTYTANTILLNEPLNQRASYQYNATPGMEIVLPQTASNGMGCQTDTITTGTPVITCTVHFVEM